MRRCSRWSRLALLVVVAAWAAFEQAAATIVIGPSTSPDALRALFHCASRQWIGRYNELYQECVFANASESLLIANTTIDATALFVQDHGPFAVHIELGIQLNRTSGALRLENATLLASAVFIDATNVSLDAASAINTTANGLRFGPGYSSYVPMGSAYGGLGGYTLSHASFAVPGSCDDIDRDGAYTKPIGDLFGHVMDFRGYGSGGSEADSTRGGGRIALNVSATLQLDGRLLADGGFDATASTSSGAGGTVVVQASAMRGSGAIHAVGGQATAPDSSGRGGGGGGGGGRIFLQVATALPPTIDVAAFGGRHASPVDDNLWCQEGSAGTILFVTQRDTTVDGQLVIKERDGPPKPPSRLLVGTPLFYWTSRREHMLPPWLTSILVAGQSLLIASTVLLERGTVKTSILLEASAAWANAANNSTLHGSAANITLHGYVGPLPVRAYERGRVVLTAGDLVLGGAVIDAAQLELRADVGSVSADDDCTLRFDDRVFVASATDLDVRGAVELPPSHHKQRWRRAPSIVLESQRHAHVAWQPSLSLASVDVAVRAANQSALTIHGPLRRLRVDAATIVFAGGANGSSTVFPHESRDVCRSWPVSDDCSVGDYQLALVATTSLVVADVHASSVLLCAPNVHVGGSGVSADGLGCKEDGPGVSTELDGASGGAGHGGRGGNVEPGDRGGGATCDASWPGSGAAGESTGGLGGGLVLLRATTLALDSRLSVRGGNGTAGGGGGAGGSLLLFLKELQGKGSLDVSGGAGSSTPERHGGGGGGGVVRIAYAPDGSGQKYLGTVNVGGGSSAGQTGYDGITAGLNCVAGCGGVFCAPCAAGQASAVANGTCEPCAMGTFSPNPGSTACTDCAPGSFNPTIGSTACFACAKGQFAADAAATACAACPPGSMSPEKGTVHCTLCPIGSTAPRAGSANCELCDVGHTTPAVCSLACVPCDSKPYHASYNQNGTCHYMCEKGRVGLKCLTPFEQLVAPIGGPLGFVLLCLGSIGLIFAGYGMLSYRGPPASRRLKHGMGRRDKLVLVLRPPTVLAVPTPPASPPAADASMSSIRYAALFAPEPKAVALEEAVGLIDDAPAMTQPTWRQQLRRTLDSIAPTHVAVTPDLLRCAWGRPLSFLALLVADFLLWFWLALQFFCIQVGDPTLHEAGCSHAALVLVLSVMPLAVLGAPLLGLAFVFGKRSSVGRLFVLWTATCYWNAATAFCCGVYYSAYLGDSVLGLSLACVKWLEGRWALRFLAQFESDRSGRGWAGLFTTRDYYDCADRPLGRWLAT
ncbi:hypothetical protein SDRG_11558 [Saprolegnia diclina VS20]|uniref:Tyrosine-protein kinase ephrin type A/B receptor-like domain-containing protein n=1 Tax=Saprolegnia diclina (strain VS20) TaxID=1156394 RepID=T0RLF1_SAPDV|nr:hypothetical protein SDRG_11558 [Saprolegnia diclina VS20]EQC30797.1 hypothetical protein SDRG_11558 [Saprolegnia diclina VS20]|eukprot:XP_008615821.1 hypothetical protein SDRG_11558 [Saprolegnia diclina VS20]